VRNAERAEAQTCVTGREDSVVTSERSRAGTKEWIARHSYNVRICHWINVIACGYLLVSGIHIFLDFPELYWGHTGYQGYPAIFKLSDWGISWDDAGAMGNRMWGRNYHFTFAWVFLINGLMYVGWNMVTGQFRDRMLPRRDELTLVNLRADLRDHLRWLARKRTSTTSYGTLQKTSYLLLIFVFVPLLTLTGLAQSPGFTAAMPALLDMFGGRQSARSLHTIGTVLLVLFVVVHVLEVLAAGAFNRVRSMITGKHPLPEEGL
jgi:thiosulfate reductase cytochrome b subunit